MNNWGGSILTSIGLTPQYNYSRNGVNTLRIIMPVQRINPVLKIFMALSSGILIGLIANATLSAHACGLLDRLVLGPIFDVWSRLLLAVSGPVIFFMVISTLLNMGAVTEQGGDSKRIIMRYFGSSFCVAFISLALSQVLFMPNLDNEAFGSAQASTLLEQFFNLIPSNIFTPIIEANTPQLLVMAFVIGAGIIAVGSKADGLVNIIQQVNMVGMKMAEWISRMVPYAVSMVIIREMIDGRSLSILGLWKALLISVIGAAILILVVLLFVSNKNDVPVPVLVRKLKGPFIATIKAGSVETTFGNTENSCIYDLGIERNFASVSLSHGLVLYMPVNVLGTLIFTIYAVSLFDVTVTPIWCFIAMLLAVILFVATPPVPGANLLAYIAIFSVLGISTQALVNAMIFDIVFGILASAANQTMLQLELIRQASIIGLLNETVLKRMPVKKK